MSSDAEYGRQPSGSAHQLMRHAPEGYECPFCRIAQTFPAPAPESAVVLMHANVFALIPRHHYAGIIGNCIVVPKLHYENALDIPDDLGNDFFRATRLLAQAMRKAFDCAGFSTRQHNGPAGDQDVWHYHLHVFPRFPDDNFHSGEKVPYTPEERLAVADRLRSALG
jgi:histidine triad (HIT) family protein